MHEATTNRRRLAGLAAILVVGCGQPAGQSPSADDAVDTRERAVEITDRMLSAYREAKSYADHATYVEESVLRGEGIARELPYYQMAIAFERPNRLRLTFGEALADGAGGQQGFDVACDGEFLRAALPEIPDQIVEKPAPKALTADNALPDPLIREKLLNRPVSEVFPQLAMLVNVSDDDEAAVFPDDSNPRLLADATLGGHECHRVATSHPEGTRVFWIDLESFALRRVELPVEAHRRRIDPNGNFLRFAVRIDFAEPTFDADVADASFALEAPPGAHRVRRFVLPDEDSANSEAPSAED